MLPFRSPLARPGHLWDRVGRQASLAAVHHRRRRLHPPLAFSTRPTPNL